MMRLSRAVTFKFKLAQVLPPNDPMTVPILRLMMAVDDVRRAQIHLVEAHERLGTVPKPEAYLVLGDWLYFLRLLCSHVHEARLALQNLDWEVPHKADDLLRDDREARASLRALRKFFSSADYKKSLVARVRNTIGSHYDKDEVSALVRAEVKDDSLLESTAADAGGLGRMADPLVRGIMNTLNGGDFLLDPQHTTQVAKALDVAGHLVTVVDHLLDACLQQHADAVVERREAIIQIPELVSRAREAVEAARRQLREGRTGPGVEDGEA